jgi:uncharacterized protein YbbC (DUF1343 family)
MLILREISFIFNSSYICPYTNTDHILKTFFLVAILSLMTYSGYTQQAYDKDILPGAAQTAEYLPLLAGKRVALVINQTSEVNKVSLLDKLLDKGVAVKKIFIPEHGFRGNEDAGAHIANGTDSATGLPVISLYGNNKKPKKEQLEDIDVLIYDLQDVGVRFYTYISTLEYCMEACAENGKRLMILDRPNPNGDYVDGPVLETAHRSFVGMQPVPVIYGMTAGEYAQMLAGEKWLAGADKPDMVVIRCSKYTHRSHYELPVAPSPNLRSMEAIYAYASLCLFEGTPISMGRGTDKPFRQYGCPEFEGKYQYSFTPMSGPGAKKPPYENKPCFGELVAQDVAQTRKNIDHQLQLKWLINAYKNYPEKSKFFTPFFTKLTGTTLLEQQVKKGESEKSIRKSWAKGIKAFKKTRKKYLLYPDFE